MRKAFSVAAGFLVFGAASAMSQASQGSSQATQAQDACQKTYDIYQFLAPQLAT